MSDDQFIPPEGARGLLQREARHRRTAGSQSVSGLECGAHEAVDMNHLDPGGLITVRLSVSDLSRAALRDGHMNLVVQKHQRGHLCLPVTWTPTSWRSTTFVLSMNSIMFRLSVPWVWSEAVIVIQAELGGRH